jgi:drug/metabolite transporter (DMT)-like permease
MLTGGIALAAVALARGERVPLDAAPSSWLALAYLFVFGSLLGFTAYAWLLRNTRPAIATSYAYINPGLAVLIGAALYGEPLGWTTLVANILIVGAVMLALSGARHRV